MTPQSSREKILYHRGLKEGAMHVLQLTQFLPFCELLKKTQEFIDGAEDVEMRLAAEIQAMSNVPGETI